MDSEPSNDNLTANSKIEAILVDETTEEENKTDPCENQQLDADAFIDSLLEEVYNQPEQKVSKEIETVGSPTQQVSSRLAKEVEQASAKDYSAGEESKQSFLSPVSAREPLPTQTKLFDPLELSPIAKIKQELIHVAPKIGYDITPAEDMPGLDELLEFDLDRLIEELEFEQEDSTNPESTIESASSPSKEPIEHPNSLSDGQISGDIHRDPLNRINQAGSTKLDLEFESIAPSDAPNLAKPKGPLSFKDQKSKGQLNESKKNQKFLDQYYKLSKAIETGECDADGKPQTKSKQKFPDHDPIPILDHRIPMQKQIDFEDYKIYFPYEPYPQQKDFITGLIKAIDRAEHMLIESPTGTGKTLCLLVGALAWQQKNIAEGKNLNAKIFYASRTHTQLGQLLRELKSTCYIPTVSILGSRDHLCVKEDLAHTSGHEKIQACYNHMKNRTCEYHVGYTGRRHQLPHEYKHRILDMEDWHQEARNCSFCPYYLSRSLIKHAHLVFLPYNYITTPDFRMLIRDYMANSIIILDEAHNMGKFAEDGASLTTSPDDLNKIIEEAVKTGDWLEQVAPGKGGEKCQTLLKLPMEKLKEFLLLRSKVLEFVGSTYPGEHLFEIFRDILSHKNFVGWLITADKGVAERRRVLGFDEPSDNGDSEDTGESAQTQHGSEECHLPRPLAETHCQNPPALHELLGNENARRQMERIQRQPLHSDVRGALLRPNILYVRVLIQGLQLKVKCNSPAFAFKEIQNEDPRCIVFTSGTLGPPESFTAEFEICFQHVFKCGHVIDNQKQLFSAVLQRTSSGQPMTFCYQNRQDDVLIEELGRTLTKVFRVTPGGVLVFFSSYKVMKSYIEIWKNNGQLKEIENIKSTSYEGNKPAGQTTALKKYLESYKSGAAFFCVFGGKLSEGIDFTDEMARLVILVGAPYPNARDPEIMSKRSYLDIFKEHEKDFSVTLSDGTTKPVQRLSGSEWYNLQAIRTASQSMGRVIRHKHDYGAILLLDTRYTSDIFRSKLSGWATEALHLIETPDVLTKNLQAFYQVAQEFAKSNGNIKKNIDPMRFLEDDPRLSQIVRDREMGEEKVRGRGRPRGGGGAGYRFYGNDRSKNKAGKDPNQQSISSFFSFGKATNNEGDQAPESAKPANTPKAQNPFNAAFGSSPNKDIFQKEVTKVKQNPQSQQQPKWGSPQQPPPAKPAGKGFPFKNPFEKKPQN